MSEDRERDYSRYRKPGRGKGNEEGKGGGLRFYKDKFGGKKKKIAKRVRV